jgi:hypothetical protein
MTLVLTQVYLEPKQKKELAAKAKSSGRKSSDLVREAVDALLLGVSPTELAQLDKGIQGVKQTTQRAAADIKAMVKTLDANAKGHKSFMAEMAKLRAAMDKS